MTAVLWVLAIPSLALGGLAYGRLPDWFDGHDLTPTLTTSVLGTGIALVGGLVTYGAWRQTTSLAARVPLGAVAAHPDADGGLVEAEAIATHTPAYGDMAAAPDPADPGTPPARPAAPPRGRRLPPGRPVHEAVRPPGPGRRHPRPVPRPRGRRHLRTRCERRAPPARCAVRRAQTGNVQTYLSALLAGTVVLVVAVLLVATGA